MRRVYEEEKKEETQPIDMIVNQNANNLIQAQIDRGETNLHHKSNKSLKSCDSSLTNKVQKHETNLNEES